ncbi:hypothetical protein MR857_15345 [bacterium]|nr:hypothetical protein [bacterium]MDY3022655.1 SpaA isopeptide-forming pilin-related protein [Oliverpabstia sp.]
MKKNWRKILSGIVSVFVICVWGTTVFANEVPDLTREGSVSVKMQYKGNAVSGGNLTIYHVGDVQEDNGDFFFDCSGDFVDCGYSLENVESPELANQLAEYADTHNIKGKTKTIAQDGTVIFEKLKPGLYLFIQTEAAEGYEKVSPCLVTVPLTVDGKYTYDVDASPKMELTKKNQSSPGTPGGSKTPSVSTGSRLPQTGQLNWPIPVLAVSGILFFVVGWILKYGKRKNSHEI